jgi:hypothetical protein
MARGCGIRYKSGLKIGEGVYISKSYFGEKRANAIHSVRIFICIASDRRSEEWSGVEKRWMITHCLSTVRGRGNKRSAQAKGDRGERV